MTAMSEPAYVGISPFLNFATVTAVIRKDMRTLWPFATALAVMTLLMTAFIHEESDFPSLVLNFGNWQLHVDTVLFIASTAILLVGTSLFAVVLAQQDRATDPRNDWMARPVKAGELVLAKSLILIAVVVAPCALGAFIAVLIGKYDIYLAFSAVYAAALQCALFLAIGWLCSGMIQAVLATVGMVILTIILVSASVSVGEFRSTPVAGAIELPQAAPAPPPSPPTTPAGPGAATRQVAPAEQGPVIGRVTTDESAGVIRSPFGLWNATTVAITLFAGTLAAVGITLWLLLGRRQVLAARLTFVAIYAVALLSLMQSVQVVDAVEIVPAATLEQRLASFAKNDANGDGRLDKAEYQMVLNELGYPDQLDNFWAQRDRDGDGFISLEEIRPEVGLSGPPAPSLERRMAAFTQHDADHDNKLSKEEYAVALRSLGFGGRVETYWPQRDVNKDGFITLEEYVPAIPAPVQ